MVFPKLFLIGFMGCGKSFLGKKLARALDFGFLDMDEYIQTTTSMKISEIFREYGEPGFRDMERKCLGLIPPNKRLIIATGGGTPCFFNNVDVMNAKGLTIYLKAEEEILLKRLKAERRHRPLIANLKHEELSHFIRKKLVEREPYYQKADMVYHIVEDEPSFDDLQFFFHRIKEL